MARAPRPRMTAVEFKTVCPLLNISEESRNIARSVLVDVNSLRAVAAEAGCSFQFVQKNTKVVLKTFDRYQQARTIEEESNKESLAQD